MKTKSLSRMGAFITLAVLLAQPAVTKASSVDPNLSIALEDMTDVLSRVQAGANPLGRAKPQSMDEQKIRPEFGTESGSPVVSNPHSAGGHPLDPTNPAILVPRSIGELIDTTPSTPGSR